MNNTTEMIKKFDEANFYIEELREENIKKTILIEILKKHCTEPIDKIMKIADKEYERYIMKIYNGM